MSSPSRLRRMLSLRDPLVRSVVVGLLSVGLAYLVVSAATAYLVRRAAEHQAVQQASKLGEQAARSLLVPLLRDEVFAGRGYDPSQLDQAVERLRVSDRLYRVKMWNSQGTVIYSEDHDLIGQHFDFSAGDIETLESQGVEAELSYLNKGENVAEAAAGRLLEVYVGETADNGEPVLIETYYQDSLVTDAASGLRSEFFPISLVAMAVLGAALVPITLGFGRRLRRDQKEREALLQQVITVSDLERRRIAAEVHDGAVQDLIGVRFGLGGLVEDTEPPVREHVERLGASVSSVIRDLRRLLTSIYPVQVPEGGFEEGLADLVDVLESQGVKVNVEVERSVRLSNAATLLFLRAARELLRNVAAHAEATEAQVHVSEVSGRPLLEVIDNGIGFDAGDEATSRPAGHYGLRLLRDLAGDVGGQLELASSPGTGTIARFTLEGR